MIALRIYLWFGIGTSRPKKELSMTSCFGKWERKVNLPKELVQKAEKDRMSLSPRLRGSKLDQWIEEWINENLDQKQRMTQGSLIASRFKKGKLAMSLEVIDKLFSIKDRVFPNQEALDDWIAEQKFDLDTSEFISQGVPPTKRMADERYYCS